LRCAPRINCKRILDDIVVAEQQSLKITESRYHFGVAAKADVVTAQAQLLNSQAQQINAKIQRGILEHAIAVLIGQQPASFSLAPVALRGDVPTVPAGVPSALLERRPDVAEAERRMAAANAQIGVAKAAYFPHSVPVRFGSIHEQHVQSFDQRTEPGVVPRAATGGDALRRRTAPCTGGAGARRL